MKYVMVFILPSWVVHRKWCIRVCGGYHREIDELIDFPGKHDLGARDPQVFLRQVRMVKEDYGSIGVCCYLLHHILDELRNQLVSYNAIGFDEDTIIQTLVENRCSSIIPFSLKLIMRKHGADANLLDRIRRYLEHIMSSICNSAVLTEVVNNILQDSRIETAISVAKINSVVGELVNRVEHSLSKIVLEKYGIEKYSEILNSMRLVKPVLTITLTRFFHTLFKKIYRPRSIDEARNIILSFEDKLVENITRCIEKNKAPKECFSSVIEQLEF